MNAYSFLSDMFRMMDLYRAANLVFWAQQGLQGKDSRDLYEKAGQLHEEIVRRAGQLNTALQQDVHEFMPGYMAYGEWSGNPPEEVLTEAIARASEEYRQQTESGEGEQ